MTHNEAVKSLAGHFDPYDWLIYTESGVRSDCIPDVLLIKKAYARPDFRIYEVKVKNSDFKSDLSKLKFEKYYSYADRVFFAVGPDVTVDVKKELEGHPVGIMKYGKSGWRTIKNAPKLTGNKMIDWEMYLALMMNGKLWDKKDRLSRLDHEAMALKKIELENYYRGANEHLEKRLKEINDLQYKMKDMERATERKVEDEFIENLCMPENRGYYGSKNLADKLVMGILKDKFDEAFDEIKWRLFPYIKQEDLEERERYEKMRQERLARKRQINV